MKTRDMNAEEQLLQLENDVDYSGAVRHRRMLSEPGASQITFNVATKGANNNRLITVDLEKETFAGYGGDSVFGEAIPFNRFAHIKKTVWHVLNETLKRHDSSSTVSNETSLVLPFLTLFYSYLFQHGIYHLEQTTREDLKTWLTEYIENNGWWSLLGYENVFNKLIEDAKDNPSLRLLIASEGRRKRGYFSFNRKGVSELIGLPLKGFTFGNIQEKIRTDLFPELEFEGGHRPGNNLAEKITRQKLYALFGKFNYCTCHLPGDVDQLGFIPFPDEMPLAKKMAKARTDERTENITPEYAVKLVTVAFDWVYNKSAGVIDLLNTARMAAEIEAPRDIRNKSKANRIRAEVSKRYLVIKDEYGFEWDNISLEKGNSSDVYSLSEMVKAVQYAAFNLIGINHGRRKNELIGEGDRPYGLYLGCVTSTNLEFDLKTIDVFIEKGLQDWKTFWCNKLVFDSIRVLEKIYQLLRPLNTPVIDYDSVEEEAREHKLLRIRALTDIDGWAETENWFATFRASTYDRDSRSFFEHIDLDNSFLSQKSHPNRRLFACLYYYRYEFAELLPLRDHLVHDNSLSTYTYVTDPDTRQLADSMQIAWKQEQEGLEKVMDEVQSEYFRDVLIQIIRGERVGGRWPRLISKRLITLSKDVDFLELDDREKATLLTKKMIRKGYKANPKSNGACFAGTNRRSAKLANCYSDEGLNPQDADPSTCHGCVHLFTNDNYLEVMGKELVELREKSKDFRLPISVRLKAEKQAEDLEIMIELERDMSEENQRYLAQNIENWTASGLCND